MNDPLHPARTDTGRALLAQIRQTPDEATLRLAYADFLDEYCDRETDRAVLIRCMYNHPEVAPTMANLPVLETQREAVRAEVRAGLGVYGVVLPDATTLDVTYGFADRVRCSPTTWFLIGDRLTELEPVRKVTLTSAPLVRLGRALTTEYEREYISEAPLVRQNVERYPLVSLAQRAFALRVWQSLPLDVRNGLCDVPCNSAAWGALLRTRWPTVSEWAVEHHYLNADATDEPSLL